MFNTKRNKIIETINRQHRLIGYRWSHPEEYLIQVINDEVVTEIDKCFLELLKRNI